MLKTDGISQQIKHLPRNVKTRVQCLVPTHARQAEQLPLIPPLERQMQTTPSQLLLQTSQTGGSGFNRKTLPQ